MCTRTRRALVMTPPSSLSSSRYGQVIWIKFLSNKESMAEFEKDLHGIKKRLEPKTVAAICVVLSGCSVSSRPLPLDGAVGRGNGGEDDGSARL